MNFKQLESKQKLAGAYYTPPSIAEFLAQWVLSHKPNSILEPSCGDGAFFESINRKLRSSDDNIHPEIEGVDIDEVVCKELRKKVLNSEFENINAKIIARDFLQYSLEMVKKGKKFDAVIGNPPFIRYQYWESPHQETAAKIFAESGLSFTKHTNAWVPFVIQSIRLLKEGGALGMVIPAEIMHVLHAKPVRQFLLQECSEVAVVHVEEVFSSEVLQGIVLLLCTKKRAHQNAVAKVTFPSTNIENITNGCASKFINTLVFEEAKGIEHKWMSGLLTADEQEVYEKAATLEAVKPFKEIASVDVGMVTGANNFFLVSKEVVELYKLHKYATPMFGRSSHVQGAIFSKEDHASNVAEGLPSYFLYFPAVPFSELSKEAQQYIRMGEAEKLHQRYKCRIRSPWYTVPSMWASDVSMLKRAHYLPRLILNTAQAYTTDTAYRVRVLPTYQNQAASLVGCFVNSLTALSAELEGRNYGGGVIELVPSEIERLMIPMLRNAGDIAIGLDRALRGSQNITAILAQQDDLILSQIGLTTKEIEILRNAWLRLMLRRQRRSSMPN